MQNGALAPTLEQRGPDPHDGRPARRRRRQGRPETGAHQAAGGPPVQDAVGRQVSLTRVSWSAPLHLDLTEWIDQGHRIGMMGRSAGWWIGDWLRYGNAEYGEKYARARKITGYDTQTLMNMVWVSSRVEVSRRRDTLSWSHHAEVVALDLLTQEQLLNQAEAEHLSVRDMRELVRGQRKAQQAGETESEPAQPASLVCPECGYSFDAH